MTREARIPRFYQPSDLNVGDSVKLEKRISHHLTTVLRARDDSQIVLFNGHDEYLCTLSLDGKRVSALIVDQQASNSESPLHITLVQAVSRGSNMDTSIQKSVELGVNVIQPIYTRHSVPVLQGSRADRKQAHWQSVIVSAAEQSGRSKLAELSNAMPLQAYLDQLTAKADELRWLLSPASEPQTFSAGTCERAIVIIGPESGLDADEIKLAVKLGAQAVTIGPRILRTETAGPACIAITQAILGDLDQ